MTYIKHVTQTSTEACAPPKKQKIAADENITSVWSNKVTVTLLKSVYATNINVIFLYFSTLGL